MVDVSGIWQSLRLEVFSINMYGQCFRNIPHDSRDGASLYFGGNLDLGKALTVRKLYFAKKVIEMSRLCHNYKPQPSGVIRMLKQTEKRGQRAREDFKTLSALCNPCGLDIVNINVYTKYHHSIPYC